MTGEEEIGAGEAGERARRWHHVRQALVCDVAEPWAHGTVMRATAYPDYWDYNVLRVEDDPGIGVDELIDAADKALTGLAHRRIDFDLAAAADPRREGFKDRGWRTLRLLYMRHECRPPPGEDVAVEEVPYDDVIELRRMWHTEDFPDGGEAERYHAQARVVALSHGARVFAVRREGAAAAFAQLEHHDGSAEITQVYVHPDRRGDGLGTAITRSSIEAAGAVDDLWIAADDEDRPRELYARLGFRPAWTSMETTRFPD